MNKFRFPIKMTIEARTLAEAKERMSEIMEKLNFASSDVTYDVQLKADIDHWSQVLDAEN